MQPESAWQSGQATRGPVPSCLLSLTVWAPFCSKRDAGRTVDASHPTPNMISAGREWITLSAPPTACEEAGAEVTEHEAAWIAALHGVIPLTGQRPESEARYQGSSRLGWCHYPQSSPTAWSRPSRLSCAAGGQVSHRGKTG